MSEWRETIQAGDRICLRSGYSKADRILLWFTGEDEKDARKTVDRLVTEQCGTDWQIVACPVSDWDRSLSPWKADPAFGRILFAGEGAETLSWIRRDLMPRLAQDRDSENPVSFYIGGYSLAGLFSLWAFLESGLFAGAASVSGSLWYPGWREYAASRAVPEGSSIYMSLGIREEKTRNVKMKSVGEETRRQAEAFAHKPAVAHFQMEWNEGGHFNSPDLRIAKGFSWLLQQKTDTAV